MTKLTNTPDVKIAAVGVSRDCFPIELTGKRLDKLVAASTSKVSDIYRCSIVVENEVDGANALKEITEAGCNALVIYLGNFGPENPIAKLAQDFSGPVMLT